MIDFWLNSGSGPFWKDNSDTEGETSVVLKLVIIYFTVCLKQAFSKGYELSFCLMHVLHVEFMEFMEFMRFKFPPPSIFLGIMFVKKSASFVPSSVLQTGICHLDPQSIV